MSSSPREGSAPLCSLSVESCDFAIKLLANLISAREESVLYHKYSPGFPDFEASCWIFEWEFWMCLDGTIEISANVKRIVNCHKVECPMLRSFNVVSRLPMFKAILRGNGVDSPEVIWCHVHPGTSVPTLASYLVCFSNKLSGQRDIDGNTLICYWTQKENKIIKDPALIYTNHHIYN